MTSPTITTARDQFFEALRNRDGSTLEWDEHRIPENGYLVSLAEHGMEFVPGNPRDKTFIGLWLRVNAELWKKPFHFAGIWIDKRKAYLDINVWVSSLDDALVLAKDNSQLAIWDLSNRKEIWWTDWA